LEKKFLDLFLRRVIAESFVGGRFAPQKCMRAVAAFGNAVM